MEVRHFKKDSLRFSIYHGSQRQKRDAALLSSFDVVLTTYETIRAEHVQADSPSKDGQGVIHSVIWHRVVLDEGTLRVMCDSTSNRLDGGSLSAFRSLHDPK
jgi:SNF2 family DNA or RNA helicase